MLYFARLFLVALLVLTTLLGHARDASANSCEDLDIATSGSREAVEAALAYAQRWGLPVKTVVTGPAERPIRRLVVGLDYHVPGALEDYYRTFNLEGHQAPLASGGGVLAIESEFFAPEGTYSNVVVRTRPTDNSPFWQYGSESPHHGYATVKDRWNNLILAQHGHQPIVQWAHLIGVNETEKINIWKYLYNPALRAQCKSANCVAWVSQIETMITMDGVPDDGHFRHLSNPNLAKPA